MKKWMSPCKACRGRSPAKCVICGWKAKPKKVKTTLTEELDILGFRNEVEMYEKLLMGVWKFQQSSIQSVDAEGHRIQPTQVGRAIDQKILRHLAWIEENVINNLSVGVVAKHTKLTEKQILIIRQNALMRERHPLRMKP